MTKLNIRWVVLTVGLIVGLTVGSASAYFFISKFYTDAFYSSLVAEITIDLEVLKNLRKKNVKEATDLLELRLKANMVILDSPPDNISDKTMESISRINKKVTDYKANLKD